MTQLTVDAWVVDRVVASSVDGNVTRYTFNGTYQANDLQPAADVSNIIITVEHFENLATGDLVSVSIPAALLPLRNSNIEEDAAGQPRTMTVSASHPMHVYYKVAPKPGVVDALTDPRSLDTEDADDGAALAQYVQANTVDGRVRLYSNDWDMTGVGRAGRAGIATSVVAFVPAATNDFYRFAVSSPIFADAAALSPVTAGQWQVMAGSERLYYQVIHYEQTGPASAPVKHLVALPTTKAALESAGVGATDTVEGVITVPAGTPDLSERLTNLDHFKCAVLQWAQNLPTCQPGHIVNPSGTDTMARSTRWDAPAAMRASAGDSRAIITALGNVGYLEYQTEPLPPAPGTPGLEPDADAQEYAQPGSSAMAPHTLAHTGVTVFGAVLLVASLIAAGCAVRSSRRANRPRC